MTLNELKNDVAQLGFESYVENEDAFIASVNRALSLIYVDRPVSKSTTIRFSGPKVSFAREFIEHRTGKTVTLQANGKAISFRSSGTGTCIIRDSTGSNEIPLATDNQLTKQFVYGDVTITFKGNYYYTVSNLAVFDDLISNRLTDIPEYTPFREINPSEYCDDFRAFSSQATDKEGSPIGSVQLLDGRIRAPFDFRGDLYLTYYRTPKAADKNSPSSPLDVSDECAPLLPLLTASFLWLDDDASKAQYYMSLYRDLVANLKRYSTNKIDTVYRVNGWA